MVRKILASPKTRGLGKEQVRKKVRLHFICAQNIPSLKEMLVALEKRELTAHYTEPSISQCPYNKFGTKKTLSLFLNPASSVLTTQKSISVRQ